MFPASCILLCFTCLAVPATLQRDAFSYEKPWNPFRRSIVNCEMCYNGDCALTDGPRCEYYADASKLISDDDDDKENKVETETHGDASKIDIMLFELVESASTVPQLKRCIPLVSQYTDCTEENICIGCKFCSCNEEGRWICSVKQKCRVGPKLNIDGRVIGIVIDNLKKKEKNKEIRVKRSVTMSSSQKTLKEKLTYTDMAKWMYGIEPLNYEEKHVNVKNILDYFKDNGTIFDQYKDIDETNFTTAVPNVFLTDTSSNKSDNNEDLLEFNDILNSWTINEFRTETPFKALHLPQTVANHPYEEILINDVDYSDYDPIRLIKRDVPKIETNDTPTILQINTTNNNLTYELILIDAVKGLNKITNEKQKELDELLNIQNNLLHIAKAHDIAIDINSTTIRDDFNKHHIAIYKLDTFEKCLAKAKRGICNVIEDVLKIVSMANSSDLQRDLKLFFSTIRKYVFREKVNTNATILSSHEYHIEPRKNIEPDTYQHENPIRLMGNILVEINKTSANPLLALSQHARKILKRVIKQLYLDDFAVIDYIVHETYYDFDGYLENIGSKWDKMMQDVTDSEVFDTLYRVKLLHMTLRADISKMEDMITLLDFARNRRMTIANGVTIDNSIFRIQNNLELIDRNVQKILKLEKEKKMRHASIDQQTKPAKKKSILQKLKKIFQTSKNDIKDMLRKRFPKSEIMKQIAKKKMNELETRRMLEYQDTIKHWQNNLNVGPGRKRRATWEFRAIANRIKSIIPGYLRGKVKPVIQKKRNGNKTHDTRTKKMHGRKKRRTKATTIKTTVSRRSTES